MDTIDYKLDRPKRSVLFSIAPIGLGTDSAESLEGYTCRLAQAHFTTRHAVEQVVNGAGAPLYVDKSGPPRLDAPTEVAHQFGRRLADLTMRQDVLCLGLGRLAGRISTMHTLRKYRAWCGDCFCDARAASVPPHLPLVWSLANYHRCVKHGQVLETQCPCCNRQSVASNSWSWAIDHCPWCNKDLARRRQGTTPSLPHLSRRHDVEIDMFGAKVLGEFVTEISQISEPPIACDASAVVHSAVSRGLARHPADFAKTAGLSTSTLHTIVKGTNNPSLVILMRIAAVADVSLAGMLYPQLARIEVRGNPPQALREVGRLRQNRTHDWNLIRQEAAGAMASGEDVTLRKLARELMVDQSYLASRIGNLRAEIVQQGREKRKAKRSEQVRTLAADVAGAREELIALSLTPSARQIGKLLQVEHTSPLMREAMKFANSQLTTLGEPAEAQLANADRQDVGPCVRHPADEVDGAAFER